LVLEVEEDDRGKQRWEEMKNKQEAMKYFLVGGGEGVQTKWRTNEVCEKNAAFSPTVFTAPPSETENRAESAAARTRPPGSLKQA
jgi:hypothetical protein